MKNYIKISLILCTISLICAAILAAMNLLTEDIIAKNDENTYTETMQQIYADYDADKSTVLDLTEEQENEGITKIVIAADKNGIVLGTVYTVTGKNAYGTITLLVAVAPTGAVHQVEFLENGQSFASTVAAWVKTVFQNKGTESHEIGAVTETATVTDDVLASDVAGLDVKCGATYGATLVRNLVSIVVNDYKEVK